MEIDQSVPECQAEDTPEAYIFISSGEGRSRENVFPRKSCDFRMNSYDFPRHCYEFPRSSYDFPRNSYHLGYRTQLCME